MQAWFMWNYFDDLKTTHDPPLVYRSSKALNVFNCPNRTSTAINRVLYAGDGGEGATVISLSTDVQNIHFTDPVPGTIGEAMLRYVCNRKTKGRYLQK